MAEQDRDHPDRGWWLVFVVKTRAILSRSRVRNSIQQSWPMHWASPSTPSSLRMMSWMVLTPVMISSDH